MAAYIEYTYGPDNEWYVGKSTNNLAVNEVVNIQADGHELEHILNKFTNIPQAKNTRVQTWYGDTAKFIVKHL